MTNKNKNSRGGMNGFTLVELLAVIVILAIILVIAVPKVMSVIEDAKKATLESTAKMIASQAEKQKVQNTVLGNEENITCKNITNINDVDYASCDITFDNNTAKVTIAGSGKFEGLYVCNGTKTEATATDESCTLRTLTVLLDGGSDNNTKYNTKYEAGSTVTLTEPTKEGYTFVSWTVTGTGAKVEGNKLTMGTENTTVTATWEVEKNFSTDSWETIVAAVQQASANGTEYPYNVGDEKTIDLGSLGEHTIRIANKKKCSTLDAEGKTVASKSACGFVLEFADIITTYNMNGTDYATSTNAGGWPASKMRTYVNSTIYNALPEELRKGIINTYVVSSHGSGDTTGELENDNFGSTDKLYLLSTREVWGKTGTSNIVGFDTADGEGITRQLDYYEDNGVSTSNYAGAKKNSPSVFWWLRSASSINSTTFYYVKSLGGWINDSSYNSYGVSPAFRLAE